MYFYIFWMTLCILVFVGVAVNAVLKKLENIERKGRTDWKPSKEQMEALLNILHPDDPYYLDLKDLYEDLKKL